LLTWSTLSRKIWCSQFAIIEHISGLTGLVFPVAQIVAALRQRGVETVVDGAHAPGQVAIDVSTLGAAYYAGTLHKWVGAPNGAALLHVRKDRQSTLHSISVSHGLSLQRGRPHPPGKVWMEDPLYWALRHKHRTYAPT
jgi:isopenicillin-N epimerase